jgi:hypothetical protein
MIHVDYNDGQYRDDNRCLGLVFGYVAVNIFKRVTIRLLPGNQQVENSCLVYGLFCCHQI